MTHFSKTKGNHNDFASLEKFTHKKTVQSTPKSVLNIWIRIVLILPSGGLSVKKKTHMSKNRKRIKKTFFTQSFLSKKFSITSPIDNKHFDIYIIYMIFEWDENKAKIN